MKRTLSTTLPDIKDEEEGELDTRGGDEAEQLSSSSVSKSMSPMASLPWILRCFLRLLGWV